MWRSQGADNFLRAEYNQGRHSVREIAARYAITLGVVLRRAKTLGLTRSKSVRSVAKRNSLPSLVVQPIHTISNPSLPQLPKLTRASKALRSPQSWSPFKTCQWIEADGTTETSRCGCPTLPGKSWCQEHYDVVYVRVGRPALFTEAAP